MKFAMGAQVLTNLTKQTSGSSEDLGTLVRRLADAAEPLQGKFNGTGRAAFDKFKSETDRIAIDLDRALGSVLTGIAGWTAPLPRATRRWPTRPAARTAARTTTPLGSARAPDAASRPHTQNTTQGRTTMSSGGNAADRRDYDIASSQNAQDNFNAVASQLESLITQRDSDVKAAMSDYAADGVSEDYASKEQKWNEVAGEVRTIISTLRSSLQQNDESATSAISKAKSAVGNIG
jgi:uncharacterized protein YukE